MAGWLFYGLEGVGLGHHMRMEFIYGVYGYSSASFDLPDFPDIESFEPDVTSELLIFGQEAIINGVSVLISSEFLKHNAKYIPFVIF